MSLWKVDDEATALLMRRFYEGWTGAFTEPRAGVPAGEPMPKALALKEAKAWLRAHVDRWGERPYEHPFYWSGFILLGRS